MYTGVGDVGGLISPPGLMIGGAQLAYTGTASNSLVLAAVGAALVLLGCLFVGYQLRRNRRDARRAGLR